MLAIELEVKLLHLTLILFFGSWGAIVVISWWLLLFLFPPMFVRLPVSLRTASCSSFSVIVILIGGANITLLWVSYLMFTCNLSSLGKCLSPSPNFSQVICFYLFLVFNCFYIFWVLPPRWKMVFTSFCICVLWSVDLFSTVPFLYFSLLFLIY